jgi:hypothetical protein
VLVKNSHFSIGSSFSEFAVSAPDSSPADPAEPRLPRVGDRQDLHEPALLPAFARTGKTTILLKENVTIEVKRLRSRFTTQLLEKLQNSVFHKSKISSA